METYIFRIINKKPYLENKGVYESLEQIKLFEGDILHDTEIIKSPIRNRELVGTFSTSQTCRYGKSKSGKVIYSVKPLQYNLPNFLITYGGKLKGQLIVRFKFLHWDKKLPTGEIISVIGLKEETNIIKTLMYHYQIYPKPHRFLCTENIFENNIKRKDLLYLHTLSIDPKGCTDIDDSISYFYDTEKDNIEIGVHIAQPTYWLHPNELKKLIHKRFSTLYTKEKRYDLFNKKLSDMASLELDKIKPTYSVIFSIKNNKIISIEDYPSYISNKQVLDYNTNDKNVLKLLDVTNKMSKIKDTHELVSFWMIETNKYIGNKLKDKRIPYRVNKVNSTEYDIDTNIIEAFKIRDTESAYYSLEENEHQSLGIKNYIHFTSPIRRIFDTLVHYYLCYKINFFDEQTIKRINYLDSQTKKFHRTLELKEKIDSIEDETEYDAYIYKRSKVNQYEIFIEELGFMKLQLFDKKFEYMFNSTEYEYKTGQKIRVKIIKKKGFLPNECYKVILI
jgi:exoribonuclease R